MITTVTTSAARVINNLTPGVYTVTETSLLPAAPAGFTWIATVYTPTQGTVSLGSGASGVVTVANRLSLIRPTRQP